MILGKVDSWDEFMDRVVEHKVIRGNKKITRVLYQFKDCTFNTTASVSLSNHCKDDSKFGNYEIELDFYNCTFNKMVNVVGVINGTVNFNHCTYKDKFHISECTFEKKVQLSNCTFKEIYFDHSKFIENVEFWANTFTKKTIFFKTAFLSNVEFANVVFEQNVLFTYTRCSKYFVFQRTVFRQGLDLSLILIDGTLSIFNIHLKDFATYKGDNYNKAIMSDGEIPLVNKRETFRIIKRNFERRQNMADSLPFKALEKVALREEIKIKDKFWDRRLLWLNSVSNNFGLSYGQAILFIFIVALISFILSRLFISDYQYFSISWESANEFWSSFFQFLNPTHKPFYLGDNLSYNAGYFIFDYLGRIFIGYGIYQFIQAFRKYR